MFATELVCLLLVFHFVLVEVNGVSCLVCEWFWCVGWTYIIACRLLWLLVAFGILILIYWFVVVWLYLLFTIGVLLTFYFVCLLFNYFWLICCVLCCYGFCSHAMIGCLCLIVAV